MTTQANRPGIVLQFFSFIVGVVAALVTDPDDQSSIVKTGVAMLLAASWQAFAFAHFGQIALAADGKIRPDIIAFSLLGASFILIIDSPLLLAPSFTREG